MSYFARISAIPHIAKPFQVEEVLARVETHLTIRRLQQSLQEQNLRLLREMKERQRLEASLFAEKELAQVTLQSIGDDKILLRMLDENEESVAPNELILAAER